jgi:tRNA threonylcarbamoyladenosine biosynthesis protein TsaB
LTTFALDTATPSPGLAIVRDGRPVAELRLGPVPGGGRRVLEAAHHLLRAAGLEIRDVDRIVVGVGPGGFTGLRIGVATALGLGQALGIPVVGAVSLEALAVGIADAVWAAADRPLVAPVIDARRREVFGALYRAAAGGALEELLPPAARSPAGLAAAVAQVAGEERVYVAGNGVEAYPAQLAQAPLTPLPPDSPAHRVSAVDLVRRVEAGGGRPAVPLYLRLPDAEVNRLRAEARRAERSAA